MRTPGVSGAVQMVSTSASGTGRAFTPMVPALISSDRPCADAYDFFGAPDGGAPNGGAGNIDDGVCAGCLSGAAGAAQTGRASGALGR